MTDTALLLNGSPRGARATSQAINRYLAERLRAAGVEPLEVPLARIFTDEAVARDLRRGAQACRLLVLTFPLYDFTLTAVATRALELLAVAPGPVGLRDKGLFAIVNCGFPEAVHNDGAVAVCQAFGRQMGLRWLGALALGEGGMIDGQDLRRLGYVTARLRRALDQAAPALAAGTPVPEAVQQLTRRLAIPGWLYLWMGTRIWQREARRRGITADRLRARPLDEPAP